MRWLIPFLLLLAVNSFAQRVDPILAMPITTEFLDDSVIRGYFADIGPRQQAVARAIVSGAATSR